VSAARAATVVLALGALASIAGAAPSDDAPGGVRPRSRDTGNLGVQDLRLEIDDCPAPPAQAPEQRRAQASEHYQRGEVLYVQGDYAGAVVELVDSYCLLPYYTVLKDIGQAYERSLDYAAAIAYLRRYVSSVPGDATRAAACAPDPQEDKRNVSARIQVLAALPARILVETSPPNATVTLTGDSGITARATAGTQLEARAGHYQLSIELPGYDPISQAIEPEIGKPYTYFYRLDPQRGRVSVRATPQGTQLFLDRRFVGLNRYQDALPGGSYELVAEAPDHVTERRRLEVVPNQSREIAITLTAVPEVGHTQLSLYALVGGGYAGLTLSQLFGNSSVSGAGLLIGVVAGGGGVWRLAPRSVPLGTSSLSVTSSLIGAVVGGVSARMISTNDTVVGPISGVGLLIGAGLGYYIGDATTVSPGDAAMVNTGALWGGAAGGLFAVALEPGTRTSGALILAGLAMGGVGGGLVTRTYAVSRKHAVLIDLAAIAGLVSGLAVKGLFDASTDNPRSAGYGLGGLAVGLIAGGLLTREVDDPPVDKLQTVLGAATAMGGGQVPTVGVSGRF
jgi:hypothetical protein